MTIDEHSRKRFDLAVTMVSVARETGALRGSDGLTVLVHDQPFDPMVDGEIVCHSTIGGDLDARQRVRCLLIHALFASLIADGATTETVSDMAAREVAKAFGLDIGG